MSLLENKKQSLFENLCFYMDESLDFSTDENGDYNNPKLDVLWSCFENELNEILSLSKVSV